MRKTYIQPALRLNAAQAAQMIAESLKIIDGKNVDGSQALTKENNAWDIWSDEE